MAIQERLWQELAPFRNRLAREPVVILLSASALLTVYKYYGSARFFGARLSGAGAASSGDLHAVLYSFFTALVLLLVVPAVIVRLACRRKLRDLGLQWGRAGFGFALFGILLPIIALVMLWPAAHDAGFRAEYPLFRGAAGGSVGLLILYEICYAFYYLGWEFFFRGYMLFGMKDEVGEVNSILIQTIPSTLMHIGKPDGEIFAAIVAGVLFGVIALRTRSIVYVIILHWLIGVTTDAFIVLGTG